MCSNTSGEIAELLFAALAIQQGFEVSRPMKACRYDFILDWQGNLARVQVKSTTTKRRGKYIASTFSSGHNVYTPEQIDFFAIRKEDDFYIIPVEKIQVRTITFNGKWEPYKNKWDCLKQSV